MIVVRVKKYYCAVHNFILRSNSDADKKYRDQLIEITVMNLAIKDLSIYYKALDRAIMQYHKLSMDEINKSIKELWQETYKGRGNEISLF